MHELVFARSKEIGTVTLNGHIDATGWSVDARTSPAPEGGFSCEIVVAHEAAQQRATHTFVHHLTFKTEHEALLEGLREGMVWVDLRHRHAFET
ncbi:UDP-glucose 4-epimerase [Paraburkholderia bannensis]|uniref:UDP-glucose 4-epimerase n=1 Tax=Paraburkholderia bannensis TaxID=765414 RepID=UPI002AB17C32|nr:UDP-glucose 4-epimerase [Paraburkholderia bannensis]